MIKKIIKKLFFLNDKQKVNKPSYQHLIDSNNFKVGENNELSDLNVNIFGLIPNKQNIKIGNNCILHGNIVLYSSDATVTIGDRVFIGPNTTLFCYKDIIIEDDVMISWGCTLIDTNAHSLSSEERINDVIDWKKGWQHKNWEVVASKPIAIKSRCWIGFN